MHVDLSSPETFYTSHMRDTAHKSDNFAVSTNNKSNSSSSRNFSISNCSIANHCMSLSLRWLTHCSRLCGNREIGDQRCLMDLVRTDRFLYLKTRSKGTFSTGGLRRIGRTFSLHWFIISIIIPLPLNGGIKRFICLTSDVCLLCTFSLTREHRD